MKMVVSKISDLVESSGMTADEVEKLTGLPKGRISKWKSGQGEPTATQALRLARQFRVSVESLIDDEQGVTPDQNTARLRVVEIANEIGWEGIWRRLIGAASPAEPMKAGTVMASVPRRDKASGN